MTGTQQIWLARLSSWAVVLLWAAFVIIPLAIMVSVAVKSPAEFATNPFGLPQEFAWDNFTKAWNDADLGRGIVNSLILTVTSLFIIVIFSASAAYPIARRTH
ncbi:MAG: carbohydrate ABC transporter permease, partial [Anaerolineae bacterium]|nr:carbohydrate ABC transporter permease [Anaerolineae bacterium]